MLLMDLIIMMIISSMTHNVNIENTKINESFRVFSQILLLISLQYYINSPIAENIHISIINISGVNFTSLKKIY